MKINVTRTSMPAFEEYCEQIRPLWDSHMLTNMGPQHAELEDSLRSFLGCPITLFSNGHLALEAALRALDLRPGCKIVTSPFTFASTVHAVARLGFEPVFCDVLASDGTMDPAALEGLLGPDVGAVLPVHVYGNVCDVDAIGALAGSRGVPVVYDAAHAFGVSYRGVPVTRYGDMSVLSFHATKVFSTVEGGAVCWSDPSLEQRLRDERNFGIRDEQLCAAPGGNAKMSELHAAMGICNLRHFGEALSAREALAARYRARLFPEDGPCGGGRSAVGGTRLLGPRAGTASNHSYMPVLLESPQRRDEVACALEARGIHARKYFFPLVCDAPCYRRLRADVPVARDLAARVLTLPLYPGLAPEAVDEVCSVILG